MRHLALAFALVALPLAAETTTPYDASLTLRADAPGAVINRNIYGQFTEHLGHCIYGGIWVGENSSIPNTRGIRNDVVDALRKVHIPVVRWPGGCFADEYHWKDGIGPRDRRPKMINTNWGGVVEDNSFGTHEFMDFCSQVGCEPYLTGNLGSGTVQEMSQWVEYLTSDASSPMANLRRANGRANAWPIEFFAIGNESWGCGGDMTPEFYSDNFRRYNVYLRNYGANKLFRIACGPSADDYHWTDVVMSRLTNKDRHWLDGLSMHYYTLPNGSWKGSKGSATHFDEADWIRTLKHTLAIDGMISGHSAIMDRYDPEKKVGLIVDEWGTWYDVEPGTNPGFLYQQNTMRDAIVAALNFNIFHRHADRVIMANIAQMVNVLQALILTDGPRMTVTPTYQVFDLYQVHQDATSLPVDLSTPEYAFGDAKIPAVSATASRDAKGHIHLSLVETDPNRGAHVTVRMYGAQFGAISGRILTAPTMQAHNTFDQPDAVHPEAFTGFATSGDALTVDLPSKSVVTLEVD
ncbi:MAG TPA: alpha-L-arabinofuranosidase C-terminal domain-containing protein [Opitutaceae bacterium]|jgi:alpha-N-arabinofuranosidase